MCTSPIKVLNKSHYHSPKALRLYITVPCGKCAECIAQKKAEWSLRSSIEYDYCVRNGGYVFFDTLTYSPDNLPRFREHACFQRKHIQDFLKRIRKRIVVEHGIKQRAFRYFYVSEYGHEHKRPHYHILFFVSSILPYTDLKKYIKEEWIHGFTDLNSVKFSYRGIVKSLFCCQYVAKYVTKPDSFIYELYESMKYDISLEDFRKHFAPFHQQSTGFGESLLFDSKNLENFKEMFCVFNRKRFTLPMYYIRRLYYKLVENPDGSKSWRENDLGIQLIPQYKYKLYEDYTENLRSFVDSLPQLFRIPKVVQNLWTFFNKDDDQCGRLPRPDSCDYDILCSFFRRFDNDFLTRYAYWKRFEQGYIIYDSSFHPLNLLANEKVLSYFDCYSADRSVLLTSLDSTTEPENLFFDSLLTNIRSSLGECDMNLLNLTDKTKRLFTFLNYGN